MYDIPLPSQTVKYIYVAMITRNYEYCIEIAHYSFTHPNR